MKNETNQALFLEGKTNARLNPNNRRNVLENLSIFYRLGFLYANSTNKPKRRKLIRELQREFSFYNVELPNLVDICLKEHYSHRLLKTTMDEIGYRIPVRPQCSGFHAWRQH